MERPVTANVRIAAAEELSTYFGNILAAGSFAKYDASRRAPFVAMLERVGAFPIPKEMIASWSMVMVHALMVAGLSLVPIKMR